MVEAKRYADFLLIAVSATALLSGGAVHLSGRHDLAGSLWCGGSGIVLLATLAGIAAKLLRRGASVDVVAVVAIGGALALMFASVRLLSATATIGESALTGEPLPVTHGVGKLFRSGAVNAGSGFDMLASSTAEKSTFAGIVRLVESAQKSKAPGARLADRNASLLVPLAILIAGVARIGTGDPVRTLAVLVVATPCPLILAVPVAIVSAMSRCAQRGVLVKHGGALDEWIAARSLDAPRAEG